MKRTFSILREIGILGSICMLIRGLIGLSLPLKYIFKGFYFAVPSINLILAILALVGCFIVFRRMPIATDLSE